MKFVFQIISILIVANASCRSKPAKFENDTATAISLEDSMHVVDMTYISWGCACANWISEADMKMSETNQSELKGKSVFIEAADTSMQLPDTIGYSGDLIRFTGQFYRVKGFPKNYLVNEEKVDSARVFRYTNFEILKSNYSEFVRSANKNIQR